MDYIIKTIKSKIKELRQLYFPTGSLGERFVLGSFWSFFGTLIGRGLNFLSVIVVARFLTKERFGEFGMIQSTVGMFGVFAGLGLGITATKYVAEFREKDQKKTGRMIGLLMQMALLLGCISSVLLAVLASRLASGILSAPSLAIYLQISAGLILFNTINGTQIGILAGFEAFKTIARVNLIAGIFSLPLVIIEIVTKGLMGVLIGLVMAVATNCLINQFVLQKMYSCRNINVGLRHSYKELPILWRFSIPAFLTSIIVAPIIWLANTILVNSSGGYSELGILNAVSQIRNIIILIPMTAFQCLLPMLTSEINKTDGADLNPKLHILNAYSTYFIATAITVCLLYFTRPILGLFGKDFLSGDLALMLMLCSIPIIAYKDGIGRLIQAKSLMWYAVASNSLWGGLLLLFTIMLAKYGATGLALAYLLSYFINSAIMVPIYFKRIKLMRLINMDIKLGFIFSLALIPGIIVNICTFSIFTQFIIFCISLVFIIMGMVKIKRWMTKCKIANEMS